MRSQRLQLPVCDDKARLTFDWMISTYSVPRELRMLVWATGISGSERTEYLREMSPGCSAGTNIRVIHLADLLSTLPSNLRVLDDQQMTHLLDEGDAVRKMHVRGALNALKEELEDIPDNDLCVVSTHAMFLRDGRLRPGIEMSLLKRFFAPRIDKYVTVIDSCDEVWGRLHQRPEWQDQFELIDIAVWRDIEITTTRMLAEYEEKEYYLLARREGGSTLSRLCFEPLARRVYLSYPISNILAEKRELFEEAQQLAGRLREHGYIVFNPISILDVPGTRTLLRPAVEVPSRQVDLATRYLNSQTTSRDFQLIDQADMIVAFYPTKYVSSGVMAELFHARDMHKPKYTCRYQGRPSPFDKQIFGEMFNDEEALLGRLDSLYKDDSSAWKDRRQTQEEEGAD